MTRARRTFSAEFKSQMVQLYQNRKHRKDIIAEYDLTLEHWINGLSNIVSQVLFKKRIIEHQKKMKSSSFVKKTGNYEGRKRIDYLIKDTFYQSRRAYGTRKIKAVLKQQGRQVSQYLDAELHISCVRMVLFLNTM